MLFILTTLIDIIISNNIKSRDEMLTPREIQIVNKLLTAQVGLKVKNLAEELNVSTRTIQYDLENVKKFFTNRDIPFFSIKGKGVWIEISKSQKQSVTSEVAQLNKNDMYSNPEARIQCIILYLLLNNDYITAGTIAEKLNMSRSTILGDMDQINILLKETGISLKSRARYGYRITGSEYTIRTLAESILQEQLSVYDIYHMISNLKSGITGNNCPFSLNDEFIHTYHVINDVMINAFEKNCIQLQQENIVLIIIRILLSIIRVGVGGYIGSSTKQNSDNSHYLSFYLKEIFVKCSLPLLEDEVKYIKGEHQEENLPVDIVALSYDLVERISDIEDFPYYDDKTLYPRLLTHLKHSLSVEKYTNVKNPFHDIILNNHSQLYNNVQNVCKKHIDSSYIFSNSSFVSYIVLHFLMTQYNLGVGRKMRVVFVCATGGGAAKILERILESEIRRIEIIQRCSLADVDSVISLKNPDFVISVFPIEADIPVFVVEPLPSKSDIESIRNFIKENTDENDIISMNQAVNFRSYDNSCEEKSLDVILLGLKIYAKLTEEKSLTLKHDMNLAFLAHIMLLASRCIFNKQYKYKTENETDTDRFIKGLMTQMEVDLTLDEIKALCYYFDL